MIDDLHIVVTSDGHAARFLRRRIAEENLGHGVVVTTLGGAVDLVLGERLLPDPEDVWFEHLKDA